MSDRFLGIAEGTAAQSRGDVAASLTWRFSRSEQLSSMRMCAAMAVVLRLLRVVGVRERRGNRQAWHQSSRFIVAQEVTTGMFQP